MRVSEGDVSGGRPRGLGARTLMGALMLLSAGLLAPTLASAFEPIEGVWSPVSDPDVDILWQATGNPGEFHEKIINGPNYCTQDSSGFNVMAGLEKATVTGSGSDYSGTAPYFDNYSCAVTSTGQVIVHVFSTDPLALARCQARTGAPQFDANYQSTDSGTHCTYFTRDRAPLKPATFNQISSLPTQPPCTTAARAHGRRVHLRFHSPVNEPLLSVRVKLGRRTVFSYNYPARVPHGATLRLPPAGGTLTILLKTVSGRTFKKHRHYGPCMRRHHHHHHHHHH